MTESIALSPLPSARRTSRPEVDDDLDAQMMLESVHARLFGEDPEPTVVGIRQVIRRLGSGGMGEVYLALNTELQRFEALKVVRGSRVREARQHARLVDEAKALARLAHPNVVHVYGGEIQAGNFYLSMEYVPGQTLEAWQKEARRSWRQILAVYIAAGQGLCAVHKAGLVHRDFKPSNVILGEEEGPARRVRVIDFGLAIAEGAALGGVAALTKIYGTPYFLSPEQCEGKAVTAASDQFSFCVAVYDALYRQHPYFEEKAASPSRAPTDRDAPPATASAAFDSLRAALCSVEQPLREPPGDTSVPRRVFKVLARGLEREPSARYVSMDELLRLLGRELRPSLTPWLLGVGLGSALVGGAVYSAVAGVPGSCKNIDAAMAPIWNETRAETIERAFAASGASFHKEAYEGARAAVDVFVKDWRRVHKAACADTFETGALDRDSYLRQKACLDARQHDLDRILTAFAAADATTVERAQATVAALPPVQDCAQLRANACVTAELLAEAPEVGQALEAARVLEASGRYKAAADTAAEAMRMADSRASPPLIAEAAFLRGRLLAEQGQWAEARAALTRAIVGAEAGGCLPLAVDAMNERGRVDGLDTQAPEETVDFWPVVSGALEGLGEGGLRLSRAHKNRGLVSQRKRTLVAAAARRRELLEGALSDYSAALALLEEVTPPPLAERSTLQRNLGLTQLSLGSTSAALESLAQGRELALRAFGADHPGVWRAEFDLGFGLVESGDHVSAVEHLMRAMELAGRAYDADNVNIGRIHVALANAFDAGYDFPDVLRHAKVAEALFVRGNVPRWNLYRFSGRRMLAYAQEMLGEHEAALALREELVGDAREVKREPGKELAISFLELGATRSSLGQWRDALRDLEHGGLLLDPKDPDQDELRDELAALRALALFGARDPAAASELRAAEEKARKVTQSSDVALIDLDTWIYLAFARAQADCGEPPPSLFESLAKLPETPRLDRLRGAIDRYRLDRATCEPLPRP